MQGLWGALVRSPRGHKIERGTSLVRMSETRQPRVSSHSEMLAPSLKGPRKQGQVCF